MNVFSENLGIFGKKQKFFLGGKKWKIRGFYGFFRDVRRIFGEKRQGGAGDVLVIDLI